MQHCESLQGGQAEVDEAARQGFAMGAIEVSEEDGAVIADEFYPEGDFGNVDGRIAGQSGSRKPDKLARKLSELSSQLIRSECAQ